jgi:hypothetical protein
MDITKLGTMFHESFSLSRQSISKIIHGISDNPNINQLSKTKRDEILLNYTNLGKNYIKSMPQYSRGAGLLRLDYSLTRFGEIVSKFDPSLDQIGTQWLLHYLLSTPKGPGATFWNHVISDKFFTENRFSYEDIVDTIGNFIWETEDKILAERSVKQTATAFLGTYTKPEGLGKLGILKEIESPRRYKICEPPLPPVWAVGYALIDFWEANYPDQISVDLDKLQESGFLKIFLMSRVDFENVIKALREIRFIEIHASAPPHQIVLLRHDGTELLEMLYGAA